MAKVWEVKFQHGITITVKDNATPEEIKEKAVEVFNNLEMDDLYMTEEDISSITLDEEDVDDLQID